MTAAAVALLLATGCALGPGEQATGSAACVLTLEFQGRVYTAMNSTPPPESGGSAGTATMPGCNDTGPDTPVESSTQVQVEKIVGVPVREALLLGGTVLTAERGRD